MKNVKKMSEKQIRESENRRIAAENKRFEKMSPSQKRVQIARDVLAQLASKRLIATEGMWLTGKGEASLFTESDLEKNKELQSVLLNQEQCEGCALGGMFMCAVERADKLKLKDLSRDAREEGGIDDVDVFKYMRKFFSREQLNKIESAFERGQGHCFNGDAAEWVQEIDDASERMRLIMENIVANNGRFDISKYPKQIWVTPGYNG